VLSLPGAVSKAEVNLVLAIALAKPIGDVAQAAIQHIVVCAAIQAVAARAAVKLVVNRATGQHVIAFVAIKLVVAYIATECPQTCRFALGPPRGMRKLGSGPAFSHELMAIGALLLNLKTATPTAWTMRMATNVSTHNPPRVNSSPTSI
jgi:hypothetical protein